MTGMRLPFPIRPATDSEASHYSKYGVGGFHSYETDQERLDMPEVLHEPGMLVYVVETEKYWKWESTEWVELDIVLKTELESTLIALKSELDWEEYE